MRAARVGWVICLEILRTRVPIRFLAGKAAWKTAPWKIDFKSLKNWPRADALGLRGKQAGREFSSGLLNDRLAVRFGNRNTACLEIS
jgi:hypothetical protein